MASSTPCEVVFGAAGPLWREHAPEIIEILREAGIKKIDAAQVYQGSEKTVGDVDAGRYFDIDTKELGCGGIIVGQGAATKENVIQRGLNSLELLKVDQVRWDAKTSHNPTILFAENPASHSSGYRLTSSTYMALTERPHSKTL